MTTRKIYDLAVKTGTYRDRDGNDKARWANVGAVLQMDDGSKLMLLDRWFNPAGVPILSDRDKGDRVMLSMFEPREDEQRGGGGRPPEPRREQQPQRGGGRPPADVGDLGDEIPFNKCWEV